MSRAIRNIVLDSIPITRLPLMVGVALVVFTLSGPARGEATDQEYPPAIGALLDVTAPLTHPRGRRLPLLLWPAHLPIIEDSEQLTRVIRALDARGIAAITSWKAGVQPKNLSNAVRVAAIQQKLGLPVCVNANDCMYGFFDGEAETAHVDAAGNRFFDESIPGKIGCPFRISHKFESQRRKISRYVEAYQQRDLPLDLVFGDWEIDGPLEINRAWEASKRCTACRKHIVDIENFKSFQETVRGERSRATRECYAQPILKAYPNAIVGNYGVYPHDGYRYWYDYFETFADYHPHKLDQRAPYRTWGQDFAASGYTLAMPVTYTWSRSFSWYDFENSDYRWFYNMLLVGSNACKHASDDVPVVPFVHWHTVFESGEIDPAVKQMSRHAYQELLWHLLLRGADSFFLWCTSDEAAIEVELVHEVWSEALQHRDWLDQGTPINYQAPAEQGAVISGLRRGDKVLVRRTDFDEDTTAPVELSVGDSTIVVPVGDGCQIIQLQTRD